MNKSFWHIHLPSLPKKKLRAITSMPPFGIAMALDPCPGIPPAGNKSNRPAHEEGEGFPLPNPISRANACGTCCGRVTPQGKRRITFLKSP